MTFSYVYDFTDAIALGCHGFSNAAIYVGGHCIDVNIYFLQRLFSSSRKDEKHIGSSVQTQHRQYDTYLQLPCETNSHILQRLLGLHFTKKQPSREGAPDVLQATFRSSQKY